jgi:arylsulfatase A-like enzyme
MDIAPTIVDLLGLTVSTQFEGTSLMPEILMGQVDSQRAIFHEFYLPERMFHGFEPLEIVSMHQDRWNLVLDRARGIYELYDWNADYFEQHDLYEEQGRSPSALHLKALLGTFIERFHGRSRSSGAAGFKPNDPPPQP